MFVVLLVGILRNSVPTKFTKIYNSKWHTQLLLPPEGEKTKRRNVNLGNIEETQLKTFLKNCMV